MQEDSFPVEELKLRLTSHIIGKKILSYNIVDSTSTIAAAMAQKNEPEGTVIFAEGQTKGRGRLGRKWISPSGQGIYCSVILRPVISPDEAPLITLMAGKSCCQAIRETYDIDALIKWPNDIMINSKKVCGILTEMQTKNGQADFVILGIGINTHTPVDMLPPGTTSLQQETVKQVFRLSLARNLLRCLDKDYLEFKHNNRSVIAGSRRL